MGSSLFSETLANYAFEFPPSNYEWKLLMDQDSFLAEIEEEGVEEDTDAPIFKIFTHREGDALEVFGAFSMAKEADEIEKVELESAEFVQNQLNDHLGKVFPHHKPLILNLQDSDKESFVEWEWNDGLQDIVHGYSRVLKLGSDVATFSYFTTAAKNECNRHIWTQVLNDIKTVD